MCALVRGHAASMHHAKSPRQSGWTVPHRRLHQQAQSGRPLPRVKPELVRNEHAPPPRLLSVRTRTQGQLAGAARHGPGRSRGTRRRWQALLDPGAAAGRLSEERRIYHRFARHDGFRGADGWALRPLACTSRGVKATGHGDSLANGRACTPDGKPPVIRPAGRCVPPGRGRPVAGRVHRRWQTGPRNRRYRTLLLHRLRPRLHHSHERR